MELLTGIGQEILAAILIGGFLYILQMGRYYCKLKKKFDNKFFDVYYKGKLETKERTVILRVKGHTLYYDGENIHKKSGEGTFKGEIIMNLIDLKIGEGIHYHESYDGFNFPKLFIKDIDTMYIQTSYLSHKKSKEEHGKFDIKYQAYIFKRNKEFN